MNLEECAGIVLAVVPADARDSFSTNPKQAITSGLGLSVAPANHLSVARKGGGACDGMSFLKNGVILYAPTENSRRENFTLAHEAGHWALDQSPDEVHDWIADESDPARVVETICDRVAALLLIPHDTVAATIGLGRVHARHILDLYNATTASRQTCAVALANEMRGLAAVVIIERYSGEVSFSSVRPDPQHGWPAVFPWRGQTLSRTHPLLQVKPGETRPPRRITWETPWRTSANFYVDAVADDRRIYAVFSAADLWGVDVYHAPDDRDYEIRLSLSGRCCGVDFEGLGYPCSECEKPFCPQCKRCKCDRDAAREVMCDGCFMRFLPHLVIGGRCEDCR